MSLTRKCRKRNLLCLSIATALAFVPVCSSQAQSVRFQRPSDVSSSARQQQVNKSFRSPNSPTVQEPTQKTEVAKEPAVVKQAPKVNTAARMAEAPPYSGQSSRITVPKEVVQSLRELKNDSRVRSAQHVPELAQREEIPAPSEDDDSDAVLKMPGHEYPLDEQFVGEEYPMQYGMPCHSCGSYVGCGCGVEPGCGVAEPSCGCGTTNCGSCVGAPGPDYWCFPVCLPRFKDLTLWGGAHGFRGPRDFYDQAGDLGDRSDSNFGFQTGINVSGRAPFIGLVFPQLSYQLGYQYVGSRFSGTGSALYDDPDDRSQSFVTAGLFRRVPCNGIQAGIVWDMVRDDLYFEEDLHQVRYEVSVKGRTGREVGIWGANSTNTKDILGTPYEAIDQFALFYRCNFGKSSSARAWVGFTEGDDGLLGAEFITPLSARWSIQSGFNYRIPDEDAGLVGVSEEAWNVGFNLTWHLGRTARNCARSPFRPMFSVADNGWLMVDRAD